MDGEYNCRLVAFCLKYIVRITLNRIAIAQLGGTDVHCDTR